MEEKTKTKKNYLLGFWRVLYPLASYFLISLIVQIPITIIFSVGAMQEAGGDLVKMQSILMEKVQETALPIMLIAIIITLPLVLLLMRSDKKKKEALFGKVTYTKRTPVQWVLIAVLATACCLSLNNIIGLTKLIEIFPGYEEISKSIYGGGIIMEVLVVGIAAPVIEELLFRGLAQNRIKEYSNAWIAAILSALIFGLYHMNMVQGIYAFALGLLLAYTYEKFQTILAPILFHVAANLVSVMLTEIEALQKLFEKDVFVWIVTIISTAILIAVILVFRNMQQTAVVESRREIEAQI